MPNLDALRSMLADTETALREGGDEADWALTIPWPSVQDDVREDAELRQAMFDDPQLAQQYTRCLRLAATARVDLEAR